MAASTSKNPSFVVEVGEEYPYPSHAFVPSFVTVKLSDRNKYIVWKTQMLCLLSSHGMLGFINGKFVLPDNGKGKVAGDMKKAWMRSDSLVKGWILGSLSDEVAIKVINHLTSKHIESDFTAKDAWDELQRTYGPSVILHKAVAADKEEITSEANSIHEDAKSEVELKEKEKIEEEQGKNTRFYQSILRGDMDASLGFLEREGFKPTDKITNNGNTALHVAVGCSTKNRKMIEKILDFIPAAENNSLFDLVNSDGSTLLHVAAIVGNTEAANILLKRNRDFLLAKDNVGHTPLAVSVSNMHTDTSECLLKHIDTEIQKDPMLELTKDTKYHKTLFSGTSGDELLVLAISSKKFRLARDLLRHYKTIHSEAVLMAVAQNFPSELNLWEMTGDEDWKIRVGAKDYLRRHDTITSEAMFMAVAQKSPCGLRLERIGVWEFLNKIVGVDIEAYFLLIEVCRKIVDTTDSSNHYYTNPLFEATRQNALVVVEEIVDCFPNAIWSINEDGHNFIQYAVINRSEKIYNMLYQLSEHKKIYKTIKDTSGNNLLHLAARLAPSNKLNLISGAALQIQRELKWFKEVEGFVLPLNKIQKNSSDEIPEMVFTREHKDLVIEGEKWMKATAESYTITAALITTIVFAAAITVPGGNNQDTGVPIFSNKAAFTIFAISDAISLFTAVTSLLMFLSILTTRFAEQDFLFKLPKRLIIGLATLFISTTAMIVAFGATLFLVFGQKNSWILLPIGVLTCLPITSFVTLQFPLIADLMNATYGRSIFVQKKKSYYYLY